MAGRCGFSLVTFILGLSITESAVASFSSDSDGLVKQAKESVTTAFKAVLDAEVAGANVSELVVELNQAVGLLSEAKITLGNGDFDGAAEDVPALLRWLNGLGMRLPVSGFPHWCIGIWCLRSLL